jgi:hypothetical protein
MPKNLDQIAAAAAEDVEIAGVRIALQALLNRQRQALHAAAHVRVAGRDPDPDAARLRDHRVRPSANAATAAFSVAASTAPVIRIRIPAANSISIVPLLAGLIGSGVTSGSGTNFAGTKPNCVPVASFGSGRKDRRHRSSSDRERPYRRAVAATWRGP